MASTANASTCSCSTLGVPGSTPDVNAADHPQDAPIEEVIRFHGHMCAGLAMGIRAAQLALEEIGPHSADEEVVALVETDMCAVDAIQYLTGCTFGKGNLIHLDHGKNAHTFIRRSDGKSIRIAARPGALDSGSEMRELFAKVATKTASDEERQRFQALQLARSQDILGAPVEQLYTIQELQDAEIPPRARLHASVTCAQCGEPTMETRIRRLQGRELCLPCFDGALSPPAAALRG